MPTDHSDPNPTTEISPAPDRSLPLILTVQEAASLLRLNRKTIYDLVRRNQLPGARRLGRALRFDRDSLLRWMRAEPPRC
jgi:excisionase family DNA binding protein